MDILRFCYRENRILLFGFTFTFLSSFGQTFLISLFVPDFMDAFALSEAGFGTLYSVITLISATSIPILGGWIDDIPLQTYSLIVISGLIVGAALTAVSVSFSMFVVGLFLLRLTGQGLSTHTAQTSIARHYQAERGRALSVINLGRPLGEGVLPLVITGFLSMLTWRLTWAGIGIAIAFVFLPLQYGLLHTTEITETDSTDSSRSDGDNIRNYSWEKLRFYAELVSELRFWLIAPAVLLPAFWVTGLFLYQTTVAEQFTTWSVELLATAFIGYAVSQVACSLLVGPLIDSLTAQVLFPIYLVPFAVALIFAYAHPGAWSAFVYMILLGATMGAGINIKNALWPELYGRETIGRVRSLFSALMVLSTSVSPFLMGLFLDLGITMRTILLVSVLSTIVATIGAVLGMWPALNQGTKFSG